MVERTAPVWTRMAQLLANIEALTTRVKDIQESDPQLGEAWKKGMLNYWGRQLGEAVERAKAYAAEADIDWQTITVNGTP